MSSKSQTLRDANRKLESLLGMISQEGLARTPLAAQELAAVLGALSRVSECMGQEAWHTTDEATWHELARYHRNLQRLREQIPDLQARLLSERARLEAERAQLTAASNWISNVTLCENKG